jgi:aspartyl-tRNA(Asn)/glutamyl-tRNA(Gln) amidotransferase subunit B
MSTDETYEPVIGLEVHVHLLTRSKLFCGCANSFGAEPNNNLCPICAAMPGVLPVFNREVLEIAVRTGLAAHCEIALRSVFARKSYFYPDLPKGYQISQYEAPLCVGGYIDLPINGKTAKRVRLVRIHIEEDAGKNIHAADGSLVDLNRSGVPLLEVVGEPDIRSAEEAGAYLRELRDILCYIGASDGKMEEGSFRCDANVSVRRRGEEHFGVRTEIKNLNSFRNVEKAIAYETRRQIEKTSSGQRVLQETLLWDPDKEATRPMRSKEFANDYRYFPEPDLPPLIVEPELIERVKRAMPELPAERRARYIDQFALSPYEAEVLTSDKELSECFESVLKSGAPDLSSPPPSAKLAANFLITEALRQVRAANRPINDVFNATDIRGLLSLVEGKKISLNAAKTVLPELVLGQSSRGNPHLAQQPGGARFDAEQVVRRFGQVSDEAAIAAACDRVISAEPAKVAEYRAGRNQMFGFFVGLVMKAMDGKANPQVINEVLRKKLAAD